ncbi:hypothetical protein TNCV_2290021 [Trichonephila clavipes]|uniref:Peptidase A2 domain-containing protein n=1 Tax=Trichonephila clavipes TaxID=2585209 RepID=A0A8X6RNN4_TRICX|nr:hypothetical protein TNCV_2290021 [Trichonephila clavipes]
MSNNSENDQSTDHKSKICSNRVNRISRRNCRSDGSTRFVTTGNTAAAKVGRLVCVMVSRHMSGEQARNCGKPHRKNVPEISSFLDSRVEMNQIESIRSNVKRTSCAEDRKNTSSNYRISIGRAGEHMRETSPAVLMAEATIPVTTPIKEENGMDDLRVVYVKVKGEQEMANAVMDTGAQMPVVRPDVVEGQSIDNRGSVQITSAFGEHEMGEVKDSNMELNDLRHGVVPVSKNLVNDMLICSSDYEVLIKTRK